MVAKLLKKTVSWGLPLLGTAYVVASLSPEEIRRAAGQIGLPSICGALFLMAACFLFLFFNSLVLLHSFRLRIPAVRYARIWFIGNMGKYIPGKVFLILSRASLMKEENVTVPAAVSLLLLENLFLMVGAGICFLCGHLIQSGYQATGLILVLAPVPLVYLLAGPLGQLASRMIRQFRRDAAAVNLKGPEAALSMLFGILAWLAYAASASVLASGLGLNGGALYPVFLAALPMAWMAGFLVLVVPGGIGIREASTVVLVGAATGAAAASIIAILLRLLWVMVELAGYIAGSAGRMATLRRRTTAPPR